MLSPSSALLGKRVYGGAGMAPNRGQVSAQGAQGYLQRELRKKNNFNQQRLGGRALRNPVGGDGRSDMRSGAAAASLQRQAGGSWPGQIGPGGGLNPNGGGMLGQNPPGTGTNPNDIKLGGGGILHEPSTPQVIVNDDGTLQLPYNQAFAAEQYAALDEANAQLLDLNSQAQTQQLEYTQGKRDASQAYDQQRRVTRNENAAGGTAFSSKYGTGVANNATAYANQLGDLEAGNTAFAHSQGQQRAAIQAALQQQIALAVQEYADELGDSAGGLGFGQAGGGQGKKGIKAGKDRRKKNRKKKGGGLNSHITGGNK